MNRVVSTHKLNNAGDFLKQNKLLLIISVAFFVGMIIGVITVKSADKSALFIMFKNFILLRKGQTFIISALNSFIAALPLFILAYIMGICLVGTPLSIFIPLLNGLGIGLVSGYLYSTYSLKGISFFALIVLPGNFIYSICLILASREAVKFSSRLFKVITPRFKPYGLYDDFRLYTIRFLILLTVVALSSIMDAIMSGAFLKYFNF